MLNKHMKLFVKTSWNVRIGMYATFRYLNPSYKYTFVYMIRKFLMKSC